MSSDAPRWIDSDVAGAIEPDDAIRPQDDFHAAVNRDWLIDATIPEGEMRESAFEELDREVQHRVEALLKGEADDEAGDEAGSEIGSGAGDEAEDGSADVEDATDGPTRTALALSRELYRAYLDMNARDALGMEPVMPYVHAIEAIGNLDDLTRYLVSCDYPIGGSSQIACPLVDVSMGTDNADSMAQEVWIVPDSFSLIDADEYRQMTDQGHRTREANVEFDLALLKRVGYHDDECQRIVDEAFAIESRVAEVCIGIAGQAAEDYVTRTYNLRTTDELEAASPHFPLAAMLRARGVGESRLMSLAEPDWLARMDEVYTEESVPAFKALLLTKVLRFFCGSLDKGCYDLLQHFRNHLYGTNGSMPLSKYAYDHTNALLGMAVGRAYVARYLKEDTRRDVIDIIAQIIDVYESRFRSIGWLSEDTRRHAIKKLDALTVKVGCPEVWPDYSQLSFKPVEEGGNLVEWTAAIMRFESERARDKVNRKVDRREWFMPPQTVNAYYNPSDNSINIPAGILGGVFYDQGMSREQDGDLTEGASREATAGHTTDTADCRHERNLGGIGVVIGHEITHAFDTTGSQFDKDGNVCDWWTDGDREAFHERTRRVSAYFSAIEVLPGHMLDGEMTIGETVADLGGLSCLTAIGRMTEGFDFAEFYRAFARVWRLKEPVETARFYLSVDVHAPAHLRTNVTVQQFEEFHRAFDVHEGDGMYLAPEERLSVW